MSLVETTRPVKKRDYWVTVSWGLTAFYLITIIWPLGSLMRSSITDNESGAFTLDNFAVFFSNKIYYSALINSIVVTFCVTILALIIAFPMAYIMTMYRISGKRTVQVLILVSMMSPPFIGAYSWILLLGNSGLITTFLSDVFGVGFPSIYGFPGIVLVLTLQLVPLIFTYLMGAWRNVDASMLEASESLGVTGFRRARKVLSPLLLPTVLAGSLLVFVRAFADFGTPMLIGRGFNTVPVLLYSAFVSQVRTDRGLATAISMVVIVVTVSIFLVQRWIARRKSVSVTVFRHIEPVRASRRKSILCHGYVYGYLVLATAPLLVVMFSSFRNTSFGYFVEGFGFGNYVNASDEILKLLRNTLVLGGIALFLLIVFSICIAYLTVRRSSRLNSTLDTFTMVPYVVPGLVIGIAFVLTFSSAPLEISGTFAIMVLVLMLRRLSYTVRSTTAMLYQQSPSVEEAAVSLGASQWRTLRKVVVPILTPGIVSGAILSWVTIITELSATLFLYTAETQTLSLGIYANVIRAQQGTAAAMATILLVMTIGSLFVFMRMPGASKEAGFG